MKAIDRKKLKGLMAQEKRRFMMEHTKSAARKSLKVARLTV
jgi:hypothetical protein